MLNRKLKSTVAGIAIAGAALAVPFAAQAATATEEALHVTEC